jgi:cephalosporin-C deacetylase
MPDSITSSARSIVFVTTFLLATDLTAQEPAYSVKVVTDRKDALYEIGGQATFTITVSLGKETVSGKGTLTYQLDDYLVSDGFPQGEETPGTEPTVISHGLDKPGFLRCTATYISTEGKPVKAVAAAGFAPKKIGLSLPVPDDFDEFWIDQKRQLAEIPLEPVLTPVEYNDASIECFDLQTPCLGGAPVSGYYAKPKVAELKSLPAILWVHGAGVRSSSLPNAVKGARAGMLSLDINAHGLPNGKPGKFYSEQNAGPLKNYRFAGRESRDTIYFRGMFLRLVRAIDFLAAQPEWDGEHIIVYGHSQGGGQSLAAGGLDPRVTFIASGVPAICDHSGQAAGRINGWPKLVPNGENGKPVPAILGVCPKSVRC